MFGHQSFVPILLDVQDTKRIFSQQGRTGSHFAGRRFEIVRRTISKVGGIVKWKHTHHPFTFLVGRFEIVSRTISKVGGIVFWKHTDHPFTFLVGTVAWTRWIIVVRALFASV